MFREAVNDIWMLAGRRRKKRVLKFSAYSLLLMPLPKMNWLFRFKKVHGWNTKRGSSISPWIVRENPVAVWKWGGGSGVCVAGLWLDPGPVLLWGSQWKHQSSLLPLQILWTIWDNFSTVSPILKIFFIKRARICVSEHFTAAWLFITKIPTWQRQTLGISNRV